MDAMNDIGSIPLIHDSKHRLFVEDFLRAFPPAICVGNLLRVVSLSQSLKLHNAPRTHIERLRRYHRGW